MSIKTGHPSIAIRVSKEHRRRQSPVASATGGMLSTIPAGGFGSPFDKKVRGHHNRDDEDEVTDEFGIELLGEVCSTVTA